jgi:uncharacterized lipoprotein YbaY
MAYDPATIGKGSYAISVRIEKNGRLDYVTDTHVGVFTNGAPSTGVKVPVVAVRK